MSSRAARRPGAWTGGIALGLVVPASSPILVELWDQSTTAYLLASGKVTHMTTHLSIALSDPVVTNSTHHPVLIWYVKVFQTDATGNVPSGLIGSVVSPGSQVLTQDLLDYGVMTWRDAATRPSDVVERHLKSKRRMDDTESLGLVLQTVYRTNTPSTQNVEYNVTWRSFF